MRRAVEQGYTGIGRQLEAFVKGMDVGAKGDMTKIHVEVAALIRTAVRDRYDENVEAQRLTPSYRRFNRQSGGLERVLSRADLARADYEGIQFINEAAMNKEAAHWRRLNFGAGDIAGAQPGPYPIRLFGQAVEHASLGIGPSEGFVLPKGFFIHGGKARTPNAGYRGAGTVGPFIPHNKSPYQPAVTVGIRGRHFLEAGLEVMAAELPRRYTDLLNEWVQRGGRKARAVTSVTG